MTAKVNGASVLRKMQKLHANRQPFKRTSLKHIVKSVESVQDLDHITAAVDLYHKQKMDLNGNIVAEITRKFCDFDKAHELIKLLDPNQGPEARIAVHHQNASHLHMLHYALEKKDEELKEQVLQHAEVNEKRSNVSRFTWLRMLLLAGKYDTFTALLQEKSLCPTKMLRFLKEDGIPEEVKDKIRALIPADA